MEPSIAALGSIPSYLLTNRDKIQSLDDFTEKDRIAVPAQAAADNHQGWASGARNWHHVDLCADSRGASFRGHA